MFEMCYSKLFFVEYFEYCKSTISFAEIDVINSCRLYTFLWLYYLLKL